MTSRYLTGLAFALAIGSVLGTARPSAGQAFGVEFDNLPADGSPGDGNYATPENWVGADGFEFLPAGDLDEFAIIGSSSFAGVTATVSGTIPEIDRPGGVVLGSGGAGTLSIGSSGSLTVVPYGSESGGGFVTVGDGSNGTLNIDGGTLNAVSITSNGNGSINLSGGANLLVDSATLGSTTSLAGASVNFDVTGDLNFSGSHTLEAIVTGGSHSFISAGGNANLAGDIFLDLSAATGSSWDLVSASSVNLTGIGNVTASTGATIGLRVVGNGSGGELAQAFLDQILHLVVDRDTGNISITNPSGDISVEIDGYTLTSGQMSLDPTGWNSLDDQNNSDWRESPSPPPGPANRLSELKPSSATAVTDASPLNLGSAYAPQAAAEFGNSDAEDVQFSYRRVDGAVIPGTIEYVGTAGINNLVLVVDPDSGEAYIENTSSFTVDIDGYTIHSDAMSLNPGGWTSLDDGNLAGGDWRESPPNGSGGRISELKPSATTTMTPGTVFPLGNPFTGGAEEDLVFEFRVPGVALDGDFNGDGSGDIADYTVWRDNLGGDFTAGDYQIWKDNFGSSGSSSIVYEGVVVYQTISAAASIGSAVPEPSALLLCGGLLGVLAIARTRKGCHLMGEERG